MKIVYFGTPHFAATVLDHLIKSGIEIVAIVTKPDKPRGRGNIPTFSPLKALATTCYPNIPLYQPVRASTAEFERELHPFSADLFVVVAYGEIIKQSLLDLPKNGCINLHPSLLPKYRGAAPIQWALLEGAKETGISVVEVGLKMDAGDILLQKKVSVPDTMDYPELEKALCSLGKDALLEVLRNFSYFFSRKKAQKEEEATYVQKIHPEMARIDWMAQASTIHNQIRAFSPHPGAWTLVTMGGAFKRLRILKSQTVEGEGKAGTSLFFSKKNWVIACGKQALSLLEVQLEGKKPLSIRDFLLGLKAPLSFA